MDDFVKSPVSLQEDKACLVSTTPYLRYAQSRRISRTLSYGHVDCGESIEAAMYREMAEERGIRPETLSFAYQYIHSNNFEDEFRRYRQWLDNNP